MVFHREMMRDKWGYLKKDGLFHGKSLDRWMIWGTRILGNLQSNHFCGNLREINGDYMIFNGNSWNRIRVNRI